MAVCATFSKFPDERKQCCVIIISEIMSALRKVHEQEAGQLQKGGCGEILGYL